MRQVAARAARCRPTQKTQPPSVAVCISGLLRSFNSTASNILTTMVLPVRDQADVFMALDPRIDEYVRHRATLVASESQIEEWAAPFAPLALRVRRRASQNEGLADCLGMIQGEESARCRRYTWVVRLRPDVAYRRRLPAIEEWLRAGVRQARMRRPSWVLSDWMVVLNATRGTIAVKDVWAVMSRSAASVYMADWGTSRCGCSTGHIGLNECRLGCRLFRGRVEVGATIKGLHLRQIVRTWASGRVQPNCSRCRPLRWNETHWAPPWQRSLTQSRF